MQEKMRRQLKKRPINESRKNNLLSDNEIVPPPKISLPWPPAVTYEDFVRNRPKSKVDVKSPNSFFVYRTAFVKQLLIKQYKFKMTQVSKWVSISWRSEPQKVRNAYKSIAKKIDKKFQERRIAIKGYRIVRETFNPKENTFSYSEPDEEEQNENIKQESIEEDS
ncbi:hypothetical protein C1645_835613, partial [Glomus cerebriforme]